MNSLFSGFGCASACPCKDKLTPVRPENLREKGGRFEVCGPAERTPPGSPDGSVVLEAPARAGGRESAVGRAWAPPRR